MIQKIFVIVIAIQHIAFCVLEMFLWNSDVGRKIFRTTPEFAASSSALAANQGLYNLFLAGGLIFSLFATTPEMARSLQFYFLGCVFIAGLYGAYSVSKNIFFVQAIPALIALALTYKA